MRTNYIPQCCWSSQQICNLQAEKLYCNGCVLVLIIVTIHGNSGPCDWEIGIHVRRAVGYVDPNLGLHKWYKILNCFICGRMNFDCCTNMHTITVMISDSWKSVQLKVNIYIYFKYNVILITNFDITHVHPDCFVRNMNTLVRVYPYVIMVLLIGVNYRGAPQATPKRF